MFQKRGWDIVRCSGCGFVFVNPRYSDADVANIYDSGNWFDDFKESGDGRKNYAENELASVQRAEKDILSVERYETGGRILDVGCGLGYFMDAARKKGWEVHGVDPSGHGVEVCRKKGHQRVSQGTLGSVSVEPGLFDVVTAFDVFEHVTAPLEFLAQVHAALRPGGVFVVAVPNVRSVASLLAGEAWSQFILPEHLNYFSSATLSQILVRNGFSIEACYSEPSITLGLRKMIRSRLRDFVSEKRTAWVADGITWFKRHVFYPPINGLVKYLRIESNLLLVFARKSAG